MIFHPYTAINASAGSGKTYALVQKILIICLSHPKRYDTIKNILALTFTNKAANEMKKRLIDWLKGFTDEDYAQNKDLQGIKEKLEKLGIKVSIEELHHRAKEVLDYILHHYSTLNISTIDKFNSKLVRSFSYELGLPHQFNLEIQNEPYLIEAVDRLLDEIGSDEQISSAFMDLIDYNFENDERVNINKTLYNKAKTYINDVHYSELKKNKNFDWEAYKNTKENIRKRIAISKEKMEEIAKSALKLIADKDLDEKDFQGGSSRGIAVFFKKILNFCDGQRDFPFPDDEDKALENFRKGSASKNELIKSTVLSIIEELISKREQIIHLYIYRIKNEKILKELLPFKFNKEIQDQLNIIETENDLVLLSKFNIIINENLKNEPSNFLYEKIGTKFHHFFIDEFQDTSLMQWENLLPLRDNNISESGNSFTIVGDPKQSIYRFRGGESEIMLNILNQKEYTNTPVSIENLENNWRSAKNIVQFNNDLYEFIGNELREEHQKLFAIDGKQNAIKDFPGRVKASLTDYEKRSEVFFENSALQMKNDIQNCIDLGFKLSDITIICRTGKEIREYSSLLGQQKISYNGAEQNIKTISEKGLTLGISYTLKALADFLNWKLEPENRQYLVKMLYYLNELNRIKIDDFTLEMSQILSLPPHNIENELQKRYHLNLQIELNLNLYNYIEYFAQEFSVVGKETEFILNFLENLYAFSQNSGATLKDFIKYWNEEAQNISVQASDNTDAIKLMTIHAAKGLEFPVVLLPMQSGNKDNDFQQWFSLGDEQELKSINLNNFDKKLNSYDKEIRDFNEENAYKNRIDRLCVLYVATTRAVEHLYLYLQKPSKTGEPTEILRFIESHFPIEPNEDSIDLYPTDSYLIRKTGKEKENTHLSLQIKDLSHKEKKAESIKIATPSKNYQQTKAKVREGILTHEILSKINSKADISKVLQSYLLSGSITKTEKNQIENKINAIVSDSRYSKYFAEGLNILSERDIIYRGNGKAETYRPDRLVELSDGWAIIDFKTGAPKKEHLTQIKHYEFLLKSMGRKVSSMEIIYLND